MPIHYWPAMIHIDPHWSLLIKIDLYWSELINNDLNWATFWINSWNLIFIDRHWSVLGIDPACPGFSGAHRICRTWFRRTFSENLLQRTWAQISIFLSRYQVCLILCSKATMIMLSLSSVWVFFCTHHVNDENKYGWIKSTEKLLEWRMISVCLKGVLSTWDSVCT